jgi:hypothetical protein
LNCKSKKRQHIALAAAMLGGTMPVCLRMSKGGIMTPLDVTIEFPVLAAREAMRPDRGTATFLLTAFFSGARGSASPPHSG